MNILNLAKKAKLLLNNDITYVILGVTAHCNAKCSHCFYCVFVSIGSCSKIPQQKSLKEYGKPAKIKEKRVGPRGCTKGWAKRPTPGPRLISLCAEAAPPSSLPFDIPLVIWTRSRSKYPFLTAN